MEIDAHSGCSENEQIESMGRWNDDSVGMETASQFAGQRERVPVSQTEVRSKNSNDCKNPADALIFTPAQRKFRDFALCGIPSGNPF